MPRPGLEERLAAIQNFTQLKAMLRDDLGWPVQDMDIDDLTFEYEPEELGLKKEDAAKVEEIRQLRSIDGEPFGIFFIRFQRKHMPVTVMRRLLQQLSVRKRQSANPSDRQVWERHDLLFVSQWGEDARRHLSFVHFRDPDEEEQLPSIRVLGWDADDTDLKMEAVARQLEQNLAWRRPGEDEEAWRQRWSKAFHRRHREVIESSKTLSRELAGFARRTRSNILSLLKAETDRGPLRTLMRTFRDALIHDLDEDGFADMYAQTVAYGMLAAWLTGRSGGGMHVPVTTPFLRDLLTSFMHGGEEGGVRIDFDELGLDDIKGLFKDSNHEAILEDFGDRKPEEDPVIHFYEMFLHEYDASQKKSRGVFYTPRPVVCFIVRSVDEMLRAEFGLEDGLADTATWAEMAERTDDLEIPDGVDPSQGFVRILDPATGTGTFLVEVIELVHRTMTEKWRSEGLLDPEIDQHWNAYVDEHLLPRLFGYELMMAPYAIAHLKIGLKLLATGYEFKGEGRVQVYLTNALEPAEADDGDWHLWSTALADESKAVNAVKRDERFTVVIGNPPYSGISSNMAPWIDGLLKGKLPDGSATASYYHVDGQPLGERKLWLQDDYVKFIRWAQQSIHVSRYGICGLITNHSYLDNPTFRGMRWSLMEAFNKVHVLDLHGNTKKRESPPEGGKDVNVFDIQQGVGIGLFVRLGAKRSGIKGTSVHHADLWGERDRKYDWLTKHDFGQTGWRRVHAAQPFFLFAPFDESEGGDYYEWPAINDILPVNVTGVVTARDDFVIDFDESPLRARIADLRDFSRSDQAIREKYFKGKGSKKYPAGDSRGWKLPVAREKLNCDEKWDKRYTSILYRPFDIRQIYYVPWMIDWPRTEAMPHMIAGENISVMVGRAGHVIGPGEWDIVFASRTMSEFNCYRRGGNNLFPLYLYPGVGKTDSSMFRNWPEGKGGRRPNLDVGLVRATEEVIGLGFKSEGRGDLVGEFGSEDVLAYIYAVFHSPEYRRRFEPMLKLDFPRIPLPTTREIFVDLVLLGREVLYMHLLDSPKLGATITALTGPHDFQVEKVSYSDETVWIDKAKTRGFKGVPEEVWNFHIGGYQVCEKWLKDRQAKGGKNPRPGRVLTEDDIEHYQKIVAAITETIRIMGEIDEVIDAHGGWPDAFVTEPLADADTSDDEVSS